MLVWEKDKGCLIIEQNGILIISLIDSTHLKHAALGEGRLENNDHGWSFNRYFGLVEENSDDSVEEEPEEEQGKDEISSIFEEEGEAGDDKADHDPWRPLRQQVGYDLKELYMNEVQQFLERGKS